MPVSKAHIALYGAFGMSAVTSAGHVVDIYEGYREMPLRLFTGLAACAALISITAPAFAQDKTGLNLDETASGQPSGVAQFDMAQALFALGTAQKDAVLALAAAKLAAGVQLAEVERDGAQTPAAASTAAADGAAAPADAAQMLAAARSLAAGDDILMVLVEEAEAEGSHGLTSGAQRQLNALPAGASDSWTVPFFGGALAEIGVIGDGDTPLVVSVTDENSNRLTCPARGEDRFYCAFVPRWNGNFVISVTNTGDKTNSYYLLTN